MNLVPIQLLNPSALWLLPLLAVPIFLARRVPERPRRFVSSLDLWTAMNASETNRISRRLRRRDWILLLQVAFLLAVIGALTRPVIRAHRAGVAVVIDVSASMGAREAAGTRLQLAGAELVSRLRQTAAGLPVRLIAAGSDASDDGNLSTIAAVQDAMNRLRVQTGAANFADALRVARDVSPDSPVWVFSDTPAPPALPAGTQWFRVGGDAENVAITAFAARRESPGSDRTNVLVEVSNYASAPRDAALIVRSDAGEIWRETIRLGQADTRTVVREYDNLEGRLTATISSQNDALSTDDQRSVDVTSRRPIDVRLQTPGNFFLERALAANPNVRLVTEGSDADVVICDGCVTVPAGNMPVLLVPSGTGGSPARPLTVRLHGHPLAQGVDPVSVTPAVDRIASDNADVVLRAGATPVLLAHEAAGRRIVTLNAELRSSSFPLTTAFPVIIANAVEWLVPAAGDGTVSTNVATETESNLLSPAVPEIEPVRGSAVGVPPVEIARWLLIGALLVFLAEWRLSSATRAGGRAWRIAVCACIVMAIAGVRLPVGRSHATVMFVLDKSNSLPLRLQRAGLARINAMTSTMRGSDRLGLVTFGADASLDLRPGPRRELRAALSNVAESATNIEGALAVAESALEVGGDRRIVLLSDGNETSGDALRAARRAAAEHVAIDVVPLEANATVLVPIVQTVEVPDEVRQGEPFPIRVHVAGQPGSRLSVGVAANGAAGLRREITFDSSGYGTADFTDRRDAPGTYVYRAVIPTADGDEVSGGAAVTVLGPPQVLYISPNGARAPLAASLEASGLDVTQRMPGELPVDERALAQFDGIVLDDVPAAALAQPQALAISRYVEQFGGGLLLLGSARTLDASGYPQSPLAAMLPVDLSPRTGRRAPSMAFVLVFDKSGSMGDGSNGVTKIELARESAARIMSLLAPSDSLGIIAFDAEPHVITPLGTDRRREDVAAALRAIEAGGSTSLVPAIEMAGTWLRGSGAARKHALVISDGRTSEAESARLRDGAATRGFELSVIAIGADADRSLLQTIAERSGGRAYFPDNLRQLPAIVARDASEASGGTIVNERFRPRIPRVHPVMAGVDPASLPALGGYVVGTVRTGAEAILVSHLDDPILAAWRAGTGRVAMFTADLNGLWSTDLRRWSGFPAMWAQMTRFLNRQSRSDLLRLRAVETDDGIRIRVDADRDGQAAALDAARVTLRTPSGRTLDVALHASEPGRYEAVATTREIGEYAIAVSARESTANADAHLARGFFRSGERERAVLGVNHGRLAAIASATGGRMLNTGETPFDLPRSFSWVDLRQPLSVLALAVFLTQLVAGAWRRARRLHPQPALEAA